MSMQLPSNKLFSSFMLLGTLAVSGCAIQQPSSETGLHKANVELSQYLNNGTAGAILLASSPWGANAEVMANRLYFSASGHRCRQLEVTLANSTPSQHIACQTSPGNWTLTRPVTQLLNTRP